ncbi:MULTISPECIES: hypothetical protein [Sporolactobacillus]|uniref:Uncharacterized protein n=1 Tax=Sporolactobacillus nakayamae TaxID=269670 RepID=A0A1I2RX44_9BACL|nr:hypothetical protein [Sporolactobacillus nakayamae]SFG42331.1 hypothetical protein SAMN02982927_01655 [Sporolactobacillus nakayamae]
MFSNGNTSLPPDATAFQPASAPRGRIDQSNQLPFQAKTTTASNERSDASYPFPASQGAGNTYMDNSFVWDGSDGPAPNAGDRQMQPPRPLQPPFNPQQFDRRLNQIERQQAQFQRELQSLDRRVRMIERRLGFPIPPIGGPGFPPR